MTNTALEATASAPDFMLMFVNLFYVKQLSVLALVPTYCTDIGRLKMGVSCPLMRNNVGLIGGSLVASAYDARITSL